MTTIAIPLGLPDVEILNLTFNESGNSIIEVSSTVIGTYCHQCGVSIAKFHGCDKAIELRHLSILGKETTIIIWPKRYKCSCDGEPTTTQKPSWYIPRSSFTNAYEEHILFELVNSTIQDVSCKEAIGYDAVEGIIDRHINKKIDWTTLDKIDIIGIDEISLKKGHKDFVTVVTGRIDEKKIVILGILRGRKKKTVKKFLAQIPHRLRKTVKGICSDMYDGFINAAKEVFGKGVPIIADRFHVAKLYREGLEGVRKSEMKRLKEELSKKKYEQLKGVMWMLRKKRKISLKRKSQPSTYSLAIRQQSS